MQTYASLFTGGGLADWGARAAGLTPVWGVEYDAQIAAVAQQNDPTGRIICASATDVDYTALPRVDVLHASPPCPNFSVAKTGGVETEMDRALADAVCRAIRAQTPTLFTLENVRGYAQSQSLARIQACLLDLDYHVTTVVLNSADYGVPQTRERLFLIAHAGGWMQSQRPLPRKQPWRGWYQAIEDLIPTLPESAFAPWQLARLPEDLRETILMMSGVSGYERAEVGQGARRVSQPAATLAAEPTGGMPRAFLCNTDNAGRDLSEATDRAPTMTIRTEAPPVAFLMMSNRSGIEGAIVGQGDALPHEPASTVATRITSDARAFLMSSTEQRNDTTCFDDERRFVIKARDRMPRAWLSQGRVVAMTPRALARFQTLPDAYVLPDRKSLACRIIGNGVAVDAYAALLRSQLCS